jgi:hypothetical protein
MFIGHYGVSFAAKRLTPGTSLGALFLAVQLLDVLFAIFVLAGVEKLRLAAEMVTLGIGLWIWRHAPTFEPWARTRTIAFVGLLFALTLATPFLPPPRDGRQFAWQALAGYFTLAALAGWLDRGSRLKGP